MFPVTIENHPRQRVFWLAHQGPYLNIKETFEKLRDIVSSHELRDQVESVFGIYLDDPESTPADKLRSYACIAVGESAVAPAGLEEHRVDGGRVAALVYRGPYDGIGDAYQYLYGPWLSGADEELRDAPPYEIYLNDPKDTEPRDLLTKLCVPLVG